MNTHKKGRAQPRIIPRSEHNVSRNDISEHALKVLYRLKKTGHDAMLVGGGVRDLVLGREPKDFDIVTDARPEEVRQHFRNCRLVGRRFRLAHVHFGRDYIEVATFRALRDEKSDESARREVDETGRILSDNKYGTIGEDVWRRDFTANALYYDIRDFSLVDYTGGLEDIKAGVLRLIGDPETRYREDPVRMLRAARFAAKLGFRIDPATEAPISALGHLLDDVPAARLYEEVCKLFLTGYAAASLDTLERHDLLRHLFPDAAAELEAPDAGDVRQLVTSAMENTDERVQGGKSVTPAFLIAVLLWGPVRRAMTKFIDDGMTSFQANFAACDAVLRRQQQRVSLPRRVTTPMKEILSMQPRFGRTRGKRALRFLVHPRFRAAYDFLLLRAEVGAESMEVADFWTAIQELDEAGQRRKLMSPQHRPKPRKRQSRDG